MNSLTIAQVWEGEAPAEPRSRGILTTLDDIVVRVM